MMYCSNECILNRRAIILMMILYILLLASAHVMGSEKPNFPLIINGCETEVTNIDSHGVKRTISLPIFRFQCCLLAALYGKKIILVSLDKISSQSIIQVHLMFFYSGLKKIWRLLYYMVKNIRRLLRHGNVACC